MMVFKQLNIDVHTTCWYLERQFILLNIFTETEKHAVGPVYLLKFPVLHAI